MMMMMLLMMMMMVMMIAILGQTVAQGQIASRVREMREGCFL